MAMQPIDLQILFSRLDTVAKETSAQTDGLTLRGAINASAFEKRNEEKSRSVNEAQDTDNELEALSSGKNQDSKNKSAKQKSQKENAKQDKRRFFHDPSLGNYIDLTG
ncbi:MAG: hypothetical protein LBF80_00540 [Spirochaetaceae bacterium]|jgi:hypothetical protein|nr:hypothetical protein [Spirochaetaceae bacterium]